MTRFSLRALPLALLLAAPVPRLRADDLSEALRAQDWKRLAETARARIDRDADDLRARAALAVADARLDRPEEAGEQLRALLAAGRDPDLPFGDLGSPMRAAVDAAWERLWANFSPQANRRTFAPLFEAHPNSRFAAVPARRLLMAALGLHDADAVARLERWFDERLERARREGGDVTAWLHHRTRAHLRAGHADAQVLEWAKTVYLAARDAALADLDVDPPERELELSPETLERLDLRVDPEYSDLALAAHLAGRPDALAFREDTPAARFEDVTEDYGLSDVRATRVAAADVDGDGRTDLCFQGRIFLRRGGCFEEKTKEAGLALGSAALLADLSGDGLVDVFVAAAKPRVFLQRGPKGKTDAPSFQERTKEAGLTGVRAEATPEGAALFDLDGDGDLDVYLAVYETGLGQGHPDLVLRNDDGTFHEAADEVGARSVGPFCGRGVTTTDLDEDGDTDLFVSNYRLQRNVLWRNDGGRLVDVAEKAGVAGVERQGAYGHTIGSAFGDVDGDGDLDLFCANLAHPRFVAQGFSNLSQLLIRDGVGDDGVPHFRDVRRGSGVRFQETHSDPALIDFDLDGDLDLSLTCVYEGVPSALFQNDGHGRFTPVTFRAGAVIFNGWGQTWFDLDDDGDPDVLYASSRGVRLFRNDLERGPHWLTVRLLDRQGAWAGVGARVTVEMPGEPPLRLAREVRAGRGTSSQDPPSVSFGLGDRKGRARVTVRFPDGTVRRAAPFVNRTVTVHR